MIEVLGGDGSAVAGRHQHRNFICGRFCLTPASEDIYDQQCPRCTEVLLSPRITDEYIRSRMNKRIVVSGCEFDNRTQPSGAETELASLASLQPPRQALRHIALKPIVFSRVLTADYRVSGVRAIAAGLNSESCSPCQTLMCEVFCGCRKTLRTFVMVSLTVSCRCSRCRSAGSSAAGSLASSGGRCIRAGRASVCRRVGATGS